MNLREIDRELKENPEKVYELFYHYCVGNEENSVQVISYLLDNYIQKAYLDKENNLILPYYITREKNRLARHPFIHECSYQAFAIILSPNVDWNQKQYNKFERRLQIFILVAKHFSNVLNEIEYTNGYGRTAIQQIALEFKSQQFDYYPDYFRDFVKENIIDKYNLIESLSKIRNSFDWGRRPPKVNDFKLYTKNLIEYHN